MSREAPPGSLERAGELLPALPPGVHRRPYVELALDQALRAGPTAMVLLRTPRGAGRRTAVALWSRRLLRSGRLVVWVDVPERESLDGDALGRAASARLSGVAGVEPDPSAEALAAALDAQDAVLVVDRLGHGSGAALAFLDRMSRMVRRGRVVALTAVPLPGPVPTSDGWAPAGGSADGDAPAVRHTELTLRDLAVHPDEARTAAATAGVPLTRSHARLLVTAVAGWAPVVYPVLEELRRTNAHGTPLTDETVAATAAAHRGAYVRAVLPQEAVSLLVEAGLAPRFRLADLAATGLLDAVPGAAALMDRLVATGLVLDDPAGPDGDLALDPHARRALLDYARGRDAGELARRAARAARRRAGAGDARGALLVALESGDPALVRDLLHDTWTAVLDGHDATLHGALWAAVASAPSGHVPAELHALLSVTRGTPGRHGDPRHPLLRQAEGRRPASDPGGPESPLTTFTRVAGLRRSGRAMDALRVARGLLDTVAGSDVARVLVKLQAALAAAEAGLLDEALRRAEAAYLGALASGALPLAAAAAELAALVHALDSGVRSASDWSGEADMLPEPPAWWREAVGDPAALTAALVRLEHLDDELAHPLLSAVRDAAGTDLWFAGLHAEVTLCALRGQEEPAVDRLRDVLARRGLTPSDGGADGSARFGPGGGPSEADVRIPPLLALDLGRLYLALGRGTHAAVVAGALSLRTPAAALLDAHVHLAQGRPRDALPAVSADGPGWTTGARLQAHLLAAEALTAAAGTSTAGAGPAVPDGARRELSRAVALAQQAGGGLPYWWAAPSVLRRLAVDTPAAVRERADEVLDRRGAPVPVEFVVVPDRQLVVLHHLADGLTSTEVARVSFVSRNTVKTQIRELYRRLGAHDRAEALRRARELGLLDPMVRARLSSRS
ncbi:LuxR C-terminal-related transcriptional regulator [Promicromonospora sp. MS192]|uniref:LuxR C-terminal-related transcriptional regulator n=1 Tax=Promicromonospora sp. MS192 TaxID=3412684 RepID=UPI003C30E832